MLLCYITTTHNACNTVQKDADQTSGNLYLWKIRDAALRRSHGKQQAFEDLTAWLYAGRVCDERFI